VIGSPDSTNATAPHSQLRHLASGAFVDTVYQPAEPADSQYPSGSNPERARKDPDGVRWILAAEAADPGPSDGPLPSRDLERGQSRYTGPVPALRCSLLLRLDLTLNRAPHS